MEFRAAPGRWSTSYPMPVVASVITTASGTLYVARFRSVVSIDAIAFTVSSAAATGVIRIVIYDDAAWPYPGARVFLSADLACATTGLKQVTIPGGLPPGTYWVGVHNPGPVNVAVRGTNYGDPWHPGQLTLTDLGAANSTAYALSGQGATTPTTWPAAAGIDTAVTVIQMRGA